MLKRAHEIRNKYAQADIMKERILNSLKRAVDYLGVDKVRKIIAGDEATPMEKALVFGGITSAGYTIPSATMNAFIDILEKKSPAMSMEEIISKTRPGDVILSKVTPQASEQIALNKLFPWLEKSSLGTLNIPTGLSEKGKQGLKNIVNSDKLTFSQKVKAIRKLVSKFSTSAPLKSLGLPFKANSIIETILGNPYTHTSMKLQHGGDILNVGMGMSDTGHKIEDIASSMKNTDFKVYRPTGATPQEIQKAVDTMGGMVGQKYRSTKDTILTGLKALFSPFGTKTNICNLKNPQTCMSAIANAYPSLVSTEEKLLSSLRNSPGFDFIGRHAAGIPESTGQLFRTRLVSPFLKSLKYAIPVGGAAYLYNKLKND